MKKNILLFLMSFLFLTTIAHVQDQKNFYAQFLSGVNLLQKTTTDENKSTFDAGFIIDGSLGYCWSYGLRLEAEYAFRRSGIKKINFYADDCSSDGHFQSSSAMANLLWDLPKCSFWRIQPFIGIGLGYDFQQLRSSNSRIRFHQQWNSLSWQTMAGLTCSILRNMNMTLEYTFHQGGRHFYNHSIGVGLVYNFGFSD